jgi:hypothetical protein
VGSCVRLFEKWSFETWKSLLMSHLISSFDNCNTSVISEKNNNCKSQLLQWHHLHHQQHANFMEHDWIYNYITFYKLCNYICLDLLYILWYIYFFSRNKQTNNLDLIATYTVFHINFSSSFPNQLLLFIWNTSCAHFIW